MPLKTYNSIYKHDFNCLSEKYLDSPTPLNNNSLQIEGYNLVWADHPYDVKRMGGGGGWGVAFTIENHVNTTLYLKEAISNTLTKYFSLNQQKNICIISLPFTQSN